MNNQKRQGASTRSRVVRHNGHEGDELLQEYQDRNVIEGQLSDILDAIESVRRGDLSSRLRKKQSGIFGEIADSYNDMMMGLSAFTTEVTRVSREVGTEGKLGGQAQVPGVTGTWKELTDNVNAMAANLTGQVRNIAQVTTAVASGDLNQKITVEVKCNASRSLIPNHSFCPTTT